MPEEKSGVEVELEHLRSGVMSLRKEIFGNGGSGMKDELGRLRQTIKMATWVAALILSVMVVDFAQRVYATKPSDVKKEVEMLERSHEKVTGAILRELENIRTAVKRNHK